MYIHLYVCKQMNDIELLVLYSNNWNHVMLGKQLINIK